MNRASRIQDCIDHHDECVMELAAMPDQRLQDKLDTIHLQMAIAEQQHDEDALALLEIWRSQTIEARILKAEQHIADEPDDIRAAIAEIETVVIHPEIPDEAVGHSPQPRRRSHTTQSDTTEQLSFF